MGLGLYRLMQRIGNLVFRAHDSPKLFGNSGKELKATVLIIIYRMHQFSDAYIL